MDSRLIFLKELEQKFNKLSFKNKISYLRNSEDLVLASDHNWFRVFLKNPDEERAYEDVLCFEIEGEWDSDEIHDLLDLLHVDTIDA